MGCATGCMKFVLITLNIIVLLLGVALTALGIVGIAGQSVIKKGVQLVVEAIPGISGAFGITSSSSSDEAADGIVTFLQQAGIPILIVGIIITVIAISGMCGACCNSKCLLVVYLTVLLCILIAQIVLIAIYASGSMDGKIKNYLKVTIEKNYVSIDSKEPVSLAWTVLMIKFNCCGANNYEDFQNAQKWERDRQVDTGAGVTVPVHLETPIACCIMEGEFPNVTPKEPNTCATVPTELTSNYQTGCYDKIKRELKTYDKIAIGVVAGIIAVQFLLILFTIAIIHNINRETEKIV